MLFEPVSNVQPFSYRDGDSYLKQLNGVRGVLNSSVETLNVHSGMINNMTLTVNEAVAQAAASATAAALSASLVTAPAKTVIDTLMGMDSSTVGAQFTARYTKTESDNNFRKKTDLPRNVRDYGAVADGVTDDSAAFVAAIAAARAAKTSVYVPAGRYKIATSIDISGASIIGDIQGYYNKNGAVLVGVGTGIMFNQLATTQDDIRMHFENLRFENVATAIRLTYNVYSSMRNVSVINATSTAVIIGDSSVIGPLWFRAERCQFSTLGGNPALYLTGQSWCNSNSFDTCEFKGDTGPAVRIDSSGGFGAVDNSFRNCEVRGNSTGFEFVGKTVSTLIEKCYLENSGPAVWLIGSTTDLAMRGNIYGSLVNTNATTKPNYIHHVGTSSASVIIDGGWVTTGATAEYANLRLFGSDNPSTLILRYINDPITNGVAGTGFKFHDFVAFNEAERRFKGDVAIQTYNKPAIRLRYDDNSKPFEIYRNGTRDGTDFGVVMKSDGITVASITPDGRFTLREDFTTATAEAATTPGAVVKRLKVKDELGNVLGYIPLYNNIT